MNPGTHKIRLKIAFLAAVAVLLLVLIAAFVVCFRIERRLFPADYRAVVKEHAEEYGLDPLLVAAIIYRESRYDEKAESKKSAIGLMQIMPETARDIARDLEIEDFKQADLYDAETNIKFGCYYFSKMKKEFDSDTILALAAYNSGPANLREWLEKEGNSSEDLIEKYAFTETRRYVRDINKAYWLLRLCNKLIKI